MKDSPADLYEKIAAIVHGDDESCRDKVKELAAEVNRLKDHLGNIYSAARFGQPVQWEKARLVIEEEATAALYPERDFSKVKSAQMTKPTR